MPQTKIDPDFTALFDCHLDVRVADLNYGNHLSNDIEYLKQAHLHQRLILSLGVREVGKARFTIVYKLIDHQTQQTIALGETHMGCFDYQRQKPARAPQVLLAILA
jgi:acyl-CoA thioesterase FadM